MKLAREFVYMGKRGLHTHPCAVVSPTSGNPSACQSCATLHSSKAAKRGQDPLPAWSYADDKGKQIRPSAGTERKVGWVVLCESCKARKRKAEKPPPREATAVTEEDDADGFSLLLDYDVADDKEELVAAAATAAAQTHPVPLVPAVTKRPGTPEPPSSEKRAPTSEARRHASLVEQHAELTARYSEQAARLAEVTAENVGFSATIAELRGQLQANGTASDADLEKRLSEYEMTKYGCATSTA